MISNPEEKMRQLLAVGCLILMGSQQLAGQFTSFNDRSRSILEGNWQSCLEGGVYSERVYDYKGPDGNDFELHLGPYHEFALFKNIQDEHRDHNSAENLLVPYEVTVVNGFGKHRWDIAKANLKFEAVMAGGSRQECESWFVTLSPLNKPTS